MRTLDDKIWFIESRGEFRASVSFSSSISCLPSSEIKFQQAFDIREHLRADVYSQVFGHVPQTCQTVARHIRTVEKALREKGETKLANKLLVTASLVDSVFDQMVPPRDKDYDECDMNLIDLK